MSAGGYLSRTRLINGAYNNLHLQTTPDRHLIALSIRWNVQYVSTLVKPHRSAGITMDQVLYQLKVLLLWNGL